MYEKKIIFIVISFICAIICSSCRSTKINDTDIISGNSQAVGRIEATVTELDRTVANSRERIGIICTASERIAGGIDRLDFLFTQYESEVERILNEIDRIRNETENKGENNKGSVSGSGGNGGD